MKRILILMLVATSSAPAFAQHVGHGSPPPPPPQQAQPQTSQPDPHAGHETPPPPAAGPDAGHGTLQPEARPPQGTDPHAGHAMPPSQAQPQGAVAHAGHQMGMEDIPAPPVGPPPPEALSGPRHAADAVFGSGEMAQAREELRATHGDVRAYRFSIDQLELSFRNGNEGYAWEDVQFWYGDDIDRLWIKSEGEGAFGGGLERVEVQALWSHAIDPWFNLQAGARYDLRPDPERAWLVLGVQGLAPYWFEIDAAAFLSTRGDLTARFEAEYDQRITQRLILQPRLEADFSLQDMPELGIGSGLAAAEAGLRLRYEIVPEFAPYLGVQYERAFGDTARFARAAGEDVGGWSLLVGTKLWF